MLSVFRLSWTFNFFYLKQFLRGLWIICPFYWFWPKFKVMSKLWRFGCPDPGWAGVVGTWEGLGETAWYKRPGPSAADPDHECLWDQQHQPHHYSTSTVSQPDRHNAFGELYTPSRRTDTMSKTGLSFAFQYSIDKYQSLLLFSHSHSHSPYTLSILL